MKKNRLLKVANMLEFIDPARLEMNRWQTTTDCGTKYCVMGFTAVIGLFKGLSLVERHSEGAYDLVYTKGDIEYYNWQAVHELFDIGDGADEDLFGMYLIGTPKELADNIRKFVEENNDA